MISQPPSVTLTVCESEKPGLPVWSSPPWEEWDGWLHKVTEDLSGPLPDCFTPPRIDHPGWAGGPDYSLHIYQFPGLSLSPRGWSCESAVASDRCAPILRLFIMAAAPLNPPSLAAVLRSVWQQLWQTFRKRGRKRYEGKKRKKGCEVKVFFFYSWIREILKKMICHCKLIWVQCECVQERRTFKKIWWLISPERKPKTLSNKWFGVWTPSICDFY